MTDLQFNEFIHKPNRLQICAMLSLTEEMEYRIIREMLNVSESVLSKNIKVLEDAGYIAVQKRAYSARRRTWLSMTEQGHKAYDEYVLVLKKVVSGFND